MSTTKFLDLDALSPAEEITIKLNGKVHAFREMSVEDFIWAQNQAKKIEAVVDERDIMVATVDMLVRTFPTCTKEELMALGLSKLRALNDFVSQIALQGAEAAAQEAGAAEGNEQAESPSR